MKLFSERNPMVIGTVGLVAVTVVVLAALEWQKLPFLNQGRTVSAYFADAGGLRTGNGVEISGFPVGKVSSIDLDGSGVLVEFKVSKNVRLGDRTEAAIKTKGLLGSKILDVTPRGEGQLEGTDPLGLQVVDDDGGIPVEEWLPFVVPVLAIYLYVRRRERRRRAQVERLVAAGKQLDGELTQRILERVREAKHEQLRAEHVPLLYPPGPDGATTAEAETRAVVDGLRGRTGRR